jgi:hypothetical protein
MLKFKDLNRLSLLLGIAIAISSCTNLQAVYNEQAYQQAVSLKVESLALMDKATTPYENHENEITDLKQELNKAYEYAKGRPNNQENTSQWELIKDPDRNLLGGFLHRWEQEGTLSAGFIEEAKDLVGDAFTKIIELESGKRKS